MRRFKNRLTIKDQLFINISIEMLIFILLYVLYILLIKNTSFYINHGILANLIFIIPGMIILLLVIGYSIDTITKQLASLSKVLKNFNTIDFKEVINNSASKDLESLNSDLEALHSQILFEVEELKKKNEEISSLISSLDKEYKSKKELLASLSHDIKTPLTIIQTTVYAIKDGILNKEQQEKELNNILAEVDKTNQLLQQIIVLFKNDIPTKAKKESFTINDVIAKEIKNLEKLFIKYEQKVSVNSFGIATINNDKNDFIRIFDNLIVNAITHSPNGNDVIINLKDGSAYLLEVINTGVQIEESKIQDIFEPFYKIDSSRTKKDDNGNGLGLYIVKELCSKNDIKISCENIKNGVKFSLIIKK